VKANLGLSNSHRELAGGGNLRSIISDLRHSAAFGAFVVVKLPRPCQS
jgi:hypothetical protein